MVKSALIQAQLRWNAKKPGFFFLENIRAVNQFKIFDPDMKKLKKISFINQYSPVSSEVI